MSSIDPTSLSVIVITSPSPSNPDTLLIDTAISSISNVIGMEDCKVFIIMDGVRISEQCRTKVGKVSPAMADRYEKYHDALCAKYSDSSKFEIVRLEEHHGFAHAVHRGLTLCGTKYAMIVQHDRAFRARFKRLPELIQSFETHPHIRYIGFTTSSNVSHDRIIGEHCKPLNSRATKYDLGGDLYLQPLIFWFDSNHLCHVERYLEIYQPFINFPPELVERVGKLQIRKMILKRGDFIEDKFGQAQRICLTTLYREGLGEEEDAFLFALFKWFGSYLCWKSTSPLPFEPHLDKSRSADNVKVMVQHLSGRQLNPGRTEQLKSQAALYNMRDRSNESDCHEELDEDSFPELYDFP